MDGVDQRVKDIEVNQAVLRNDFVHILEKLQDVVEQLKIYNEKLPEIINLDKRLTHIEFVVSDIATKQNSSWFSTLKPGFIVWAILVALAFLTGQADILAQLGLVLPAK